MAILRGINSLLGLAPCAPPEITENDHNLWNPLVSLTGRPLNPYESDGGRGWPAMITACAMFAPISQDTPPQNEEPAKPMKKWWGWKKTRNFLLESTGLKLQGGSCQTSRVMLNSQNSLITDYPVILRTLGFVWSSIRRKIHSSLVTLLAHPISPGTPWKMNMEHTNHPIGKENHLPNLQDRVPW